MADKNKFLKIKMLLIECIFLVSPSTEMRVAVLQRNMFLIESVLLSSFLFWLSVFQSSASVLPTWNRWRLLLNRIRFLFDFCYFMRNLDKNVNDYVKMRELKILS